MAKQKATKRRARPLGRWGLAAWLYWVLITPAAALAGVPEPDHLFYGRVVEGSQLVTDAVVELRRSEDESDVLASATPGGIPGDVELFLLRVRIEQPESAGEPRKPGVARLGDEAVVYVNDTPMAMLHIGGRGLAVRMDLDLAAAGVGEPGGAPADSDGDGVPDYADNCHLANAAQDDADGNGIGDACEGLVNPAPAYAKVLDAGNAPDPETGYGSVTYEFDLAGTEVNNADYAVFLGSVAVVEDRKGLYHDAMASDPRGGIVRSGSAGAYQYRVKPNMANKPVNYVSWLDAARYVNWLQNGKPVGLQDASTTETGAFDLRVEAAAVNASLLQSASWSLPTEDEWYKAAYYDPERSGEPWWLYPTREDEEPVPPIANTSGDVANPAQSVVNYASAADWNGQDGNVTSVGSSGSASWAGGHDLGGNVSEWLGADAEGGQRVARGGSFQDDRFALESLADTQDRAAVLRDPAYEGPDTGFRVVNIPEPGSLLLALAATTLLATLRRHRE